MFKYPLISIIQIFFFLSVYGAKNDTVFFQNGNKVTWEVKIMENNPLELSTDDDGKIKIEWDKIDSIHIKQRMLIEYSDGSILFGTLKPTSTPKLARLILDDMTSLALQHISVVRITSDDIHFLFHIDGKMNTGFSYEKASDLGRFNLAGDILYNHNMNQFEIDYSILTEQKDEERNQQHSDGIQYVRLLPKKWFVFNRNFAESKSELGVQLRTNYAFIF